jgi:hypothetical protein
VTDGAGCAGWLWGGELPADDCRPSCEALARGGIFSDRAVGLLAPVAAVGALCARLALAPRVRPGTAADTAAATAAVSAPAPKMDIRRTRTTRRRASSRVRCASLCRLSRYLAMEPKLPGVDQLSLRAV